MDKDILDKFDYAPEIPDKSENKAKAADKPSRIYLEQLLCLMLIAIVAYMGSGLRVVAMAAFSLGGAVIMDIIGCALTKKTYNPLDLSTLTAGLCIALLMPAGAAYKLVFFGSMLTIAVKHIFGGKNNYIFNPTATAFVFMILCYPGAMLLFPKPHEHLPVWDEINPALLSGLTPLDPVGSFDILMGNFSGAMGTVHILVIAVSGISLLFRRSVSAPFTVTAIVVNVMFAGSMTGGENGIVHGILTVMVSGYFLFILIFLANDPQTLPKTFLGKIYYGVMFGGAVALFRHFGKVEGYPAFVLLLVNTMTERSDILAQKTVTEVKRTVKFMQRRLNSYERIREKAQTVDEALLRPALTDTQEIILDQQDYNMPPIDNTIIKINRKKPGLIARIKEKLGSVAEKKKFSQMPQHEPHPHHKLNFIEILFDGFKELGGAFKKKEIISEAVEPDPADELTPLKLSLLIDDTDVVEITDDDPAVLNEDSETTQDENTEDIDIGADKTEDIELKMKDIMSNEKGKGKLKRENKKESKKENKKEKQDNKSKQEKQEKQDKKEKKQKPEKKPKKTKQDKKEAGVSSENGKK